MCVYILIATYLTTLLLNFSIFNCFSYKIYCVIPLWVLIVISPVAFLRSFFPAICFSVSVPFLFSFWFDSAFPVILFIINDIL